MERAARPEPETSREDTELLIALYRKQEGGTVRSYAALLVGLPALIIVVLIMGYVPIVSSWLGLA